MIGRDPIVPMNLLLNTTVKYVVTEKNILSLEDLLPSCSVTGLPPHLGGVACALGPQQWTNNSTDLLDMKYVIHLLSVGASIKR